MTEYQWFVYGAKEIFKDYFWKTTHRIFAVLVGGFLMNTILPYVFHLAKTHEAQIDLILYVFLVLFTFIFCVLSVPIVLWLPDWIRSLFKTIIFYGKRKAEKSVRNL